MQGNPFASTVAAIVRRLSGHRATEPRGVRPQSSERQRARISPSPAKTRSASPRACTVRTDTAVLLRSPWCPPARATRRGRLAGCRALRQAVSADRLRLEALAEARDQRPPGRAPQLSDQSVHGASAPLLVVPAHAGGNRTSNAAAERASRAVRDGDAYPVIPV